MEFRVAVLCPLMQGHWDVEESTNRKCDEQNREGLHCYPPSLFLKDEALEFTIDVAAVADQPATSPGFVLNCIL
jgi:hypothetical protein